MTYPKKINALGYREYTLVLFYLETYAPHALMDDVPDPPQFILGAGKNGTIIAIAIKERHSETVFKNVIEMNGQEQIA